MNSRATPDFWKRYQALPATTQKLARKNFDLWRQNPLHPSLHFKPIQPPLWSVRVGNHYRAVGQFMGETFLWDWIGTHEEYNKRFR